MKRLGSLWILAVLVAVLWPTAAFQQGMDTRSSYVGGARVTIRDASNPGAYAAVTHSNELTVNCTTGCSASSINGAPVSQSGQFTIQAAHIVGSPNVGLGVLVSHAGEMLVNCTTGCAGTPGNTPVNQSGSWTVQAAHLAGTPSVSQAGSPWSMRSHAQQSGAWEISAAHIVGSPNVGLGVLVSHTGEMFVNCTTGCSAGSSDAINVFHQSTIRHISSVIHVSIIDWQRWAHLQVSQSGPWSVQAAHLAGVPSISQGTQWSVLAHAQQSGSWTVQAAHQGGEWNVRHIGSVSHVLVTQSERNRLAFHQTDAICLTCSAWVSHAGAQRIEGQGTAGSAAGGVLTVQGAASMTPVQISPRDATCTTCTARVDHYNVLTIQPHISGAFRVQQYSACGTSATQIIATNANRRDLIIQNLGGPTVSAGAHSNVYLGFGVTGHVALTINNGWVLHAMTSAITTATTTDRGIGFGDFTTRLELRNYAGPVSCIAATTGPLGATLNIIEILR